MNRRERRRSGKSDPFSADEIDVRSATGLYSERRYDDADLILRRILKRNPRHASALQLAGAVAYAGGRLEDAVALFERAAAVEPGNTRSRNNLALALLKQGKPDRAALELSAAVEISPDAPEIHANLGKALHALGSLEEADRAYERAIKLNPRLLEARCDRAATLYVQGKLDAAVMEYEAALAIDPSFALALSNLGRLRFEQADFASAETLLRRYLRSDPRDAQGVRFLLAAMGKEELPARVSEAFLKQVYAGRAQRWDGVADYNAPKLVADALERHASQGSLSIADLGCGTGLVGERVRSLAQRLDGVDLSSEMLAVAAAKGVYDGLHLRELTGWLSQNKERCDAIVSAATLIHIGDLRPVFEAASGALRPGGLFVFTLLAARDPADDGKAVAASGDLALSGCFLHGRGYVATAAAEASLQVVQLSEEVHEVSRGAPVHGLLVVLRRPA